MAPHRIGAVLLAAALAWAVACTPSSPPEGASPVLPHGALARLEFVRGGERVGFGPFVGYYFRPYDISDLTRLEFWCFNERSYYTTDLPPGALLFTGEARLAELPGDAAALPRDPVERIVPVFFGDAPSAWLDTRPEPREAFVHFHSGYRIDGPARVGFWLRHEGAATFRYDMGGRVGSGSPLYHTVAPGPDPSFPRIVEFDRGPAR